MNSSTVEEVSDVTASGTAAQRRKARAEAREERFAERSARHGSDPNMDPRRLRFYLDRELVSMATVADMLGLTGKQRIYESRGGRRPADGSVPQPPHPSAFIDIDAWDAGGMKVERGRVYEFAEQARNYVLDLDTGELIKGRNRHGRSRRDRTTLSTIHQPGTPRRPRQRKAGPGE